MFIPKYELSNCVYSKYIGHNENTNMVTREVNEYIRKKELNQIRPVHQVIHVSKKSKKKEKKNLVTLEVYAEVS